MNKTSIEWTDYTSNLIRYRDPEGRSVHGCIKVSPGCANCYASAWSARGLTGERDGAFTAKRQATLTPYFDDAEAQRILRTRVTGKRVFVGDMTDVFGEWVPDTLLDRVFAVFALRPDLTFQVLTKRSERMREYLANPYTSAVAAGMRWPLPNVWLGVSVEDQAAADERIPALLDTPAAVRFLSCEPLLGPVFIECLEFAGAGYGLFPGGDPRRFRPDPEECTPAELAAWKSACAEWDAGIGTDRRASCLTMGDGSAWRGKGVGIGVYQVPPGVDWVIAGGESGPGARPCDVGWIRDIVQQCRAASVPVFVKQLGARPTTTRWNRDFADQLLLRPRKGSDMSEWPEDLRMRQYPDV